MIILISQLKTSCMVKDQAFEQAFDDEYIEYDEYFVLNGLLTKKTRSSTKRTNYWDVGWGKMLRDPELQNPFSRQAKRFRRRFCVTFGLFH